MIGILSMGDILLIHMLFIDILESLRSRRLDATRDASYFPTEGRTGLNLLGRDDQRRNDKILWRMPTLAIASLARLRGLTAKILTPLNLKFPGGISLSFRWE